MLVVLYFLSVLDIIYFLTVLISAGAILVKYFFGNSLLIITNSRYFYLESMMFSPLPTFPYTAEFKIKSETNVDIDLSPIPFGGSNFFEDQEKIHFYYYDDKFFEFINNLSIQDKFSVTIRSIQKKIGFTVVILYFLVIIIVIILTIYHFSIGLYILAGICFILSLSSMLMNFYHNLRGRRSLAQTMSNLKSQLYNNETTEMTNLS